MNEDSPRPAAPPPHGADHALTSEELAATILKYERAAPRYTSYPTAPAFRDEFGAEEFEAALGRARRPVSLYVHIPFCEHRCLYCGCNVVISRKREIAEPYLDTLDREIELQRHALRSEQPVLQLHLGGGTPTYLDPDQLSRLLASLRGAFPIADEAEVSIEVDPVVTTADHVHRLRELGFNRISMGVQDLEPAVQQAVERIQPTALTEEFFSTCRDAGFLSINLDLIYGLPHQTPETFRRTVEQVLAWRPDRVALFNYAHVPGLKPHQKKMPLAALPDSTTRLRIYTESIVRFREDGYRLVGMDHFAVPEDELAVAHAGQRLRRNFMGYTTLPETDVVALGVSSISEVAGCYAQNHSHLAHYRRAVDGGRLATARGYELTADDLLRREVIMGIMCNSVVDKAAVERHHGIAFDEHFAAELGALEPLVADGLVRAGDERIEVTERGQIVVRNVALVFDAHLARMQARGDGPAFSRTV